MTVFLVRHRQDTDNAEGVLNGRRDNPLTDVGRQQAKNAAEKLKRHAIRAVYASPLTRAHETARIIAAELGVDGVVSDRRLMERDFGVLTGKPVTDIPKYAGKVLPTEKVTYFLEAEGAEDFPTLLTRGREALDGIRRKHPNENVAIVTHGDIGKMMRAAHYGWTWEQGLLAPHFDNTGIFELPDGRDA